MVDDEVLALDKTGPPELIQERLVCGAHHTVGQNRTEHGYPSWRLALLPKRSNRPGGRAPKQHDEQRRFMWNLLLPESVHRTLSLPWAWPTSLAGGPESF